MLARRPRQASLPEDLEEATIDSMTTGQVAYSVPWAMWVDGQRKCWLHPKYFIYEQTGGTVQMRIELREDGYHVWVSGCDHKWSPQLEPSYTSSADIQYIPVAELHR